MAGSLERLENTGKPHAGGIGIGWHVWEEVGDRVAYIATSKGEVRSVRSSFSGVVVYISQLPASKPEKLLFVIVGGENVRRARIS